MADGVIPGNLLVAGWVLIAGADGWERSHFSAAAAEHHLVVRPEHSSPQAIPLRRVTALDEILGAPAGYQHVEIAVDGEPVIEAVWPPAFSDELMAALRSTIDDAPTVPVPQPVAVSPTRSRLVATLTIGLALVGCGAIVMGVLGLVNEPDGTRVETAVLTQTTVREAATTTLPLAAPVFPEDPKSTTCLVDRISTEATTTLLPPDDCPPS